jgi:formylglycine-generating enzyme required for sulfatase activity
MQPLGIDPRLLVRRLEGEKDASARSALIVSLGEFTGEQLPQEVRRPLVDKLLGWYRDDPDPGIHGAIDWLLRQGTEGPVDRPLDWGQADALSKIDDELKRRDPDATRRWYVNGQGQTMTLIPGPVEFLMGSPGTDPDRHTNEALHLRRIPRSFAISSKPVTVRQWQQFMKERPDVRHNYTKRYSPEPDGPIISVTWFEAAQYCNWLSEKEGIPESEWCYPRHADIKEGMKPYPDYLKRKGYRLPTEAEWEYACRAETITSRYYGNTVELLPRYAWFIENSQDRTWPVGQKRPNDLGLFDMHGNVWNWCQNPGFVYPGQEGDKPVLDQENISEVLSTINRVLRGGSFSDQPSLVRSPYRYGYRPSFRLSNYGLRLARTYD